MQEAGKEWAAKHNGLHALGGRKKKSPEPLAVEGRNSDADISPADSSGEAGVWDKIEVSREKARG